MSTKQQEEIARLKELLKDSYTHIVHGYSTWGTERLVKNIETYFKIERPSFPEAWFPSMVDLTSRNLEVINDMIYTEMTMSAIGLKHGISPARVSQIFLKQMRRLIHPARGGPYAWIESASKYCNLGENGDKAFHRRVPLCVVDNAFDKNVSRPMDIKDALALAQTLNREKRELTLEEQADPDRVRETPPPSEVVEIPVDVRYEQQLIPRVRKLLSEPIEHLEFSARTLNCLKNYGDITTVGALVECNEAALFCIPNFGMKSLREVKDVLGSHDLQLASTVTPKDRMTYNQEVHYCKAVMEALINGPVVHVTA